MYEDTSIEIDFYFHVFHFFIKLFKATTLRFHFKGQCMIEMLKRRGAYSLNSLNS